jgi:hypothetical protein
VNSSLEVAQFEWYYEVNVDLKNRGNIISFVIKSMKKIIIGALMFSPVIASAQLGNVQDLIESVKNIIDILIPLVAALALLYFFWGLAQFILNSGSDDAKTEAKNKMIWGIVALFVMVSVWGLVRWLGDAIGVDTAGQDVQPIPSVED